MNGRTTIEGIIYSDTDTVKITAIVPTLANKARATQIRRCVESIRCSSANPIKIIVVVNGDHYDPDVCAWLQSQADIRFEKIPTPSSPLAVLHARQLVETPYFSTLDDDDEYLPGSSDIKLSALQAQADAHLVVSNSYRHESGTDSLLFEGFSSVSTDPLSGLFRISWLNSGNALYRTDSVPSRYFENAHPFVEWTWLAYRLALDGKKIVALDTPCVRINVTPGSLSKSDAYRMAHLGLFERMLAMQPPAPVAQLIRFRMRDAWHDHSTRALERGERREALRSHLKSLCMPGGLRYWTYSRHLIPGWPWN